MRRAQIALIGAGKLARVLGPALSAAGHRVAAVASAGGASARRLARALPGATADDVAGAAARGRVVLLAVPDRTIGDVARLLAVEVPARHLRRACFLHHAGALDASTLASLAAAGAGTGVLHPLLVCGSALARDWLRGSYARVEGDRRGLRAARGLARDLGLVPLRLANPASRRAGRVARQRYHAAAAMASNDALALLDLAAGALAAAGIERAVAQRALARLMQGTLAQAERDGLASALTGPVARGDAETLRGHLTTLNVRARGVHRALSEELVRLARRAGRLDAAGARALRRLLR